MALGPDTQVRSLLCSIASVRGEFDAEEPSVHRRAVGQAKGKEKPSPGKGEGKRKEQTKE